MMATEERKFTGATLVQSVVTFLLNFILQAGLMVLLVYLQEGEGYARYISDHLSELLFTIGCLFLLFWIVYLYYYFENRSALTQMKNIWLIFLAMDVSIALFYVGDVFNHYVRPMALFALLMLFLINYREAVFLNIIFSVIVFLMDVFLKNVGETGIGEELFSTFMICFVGGMFALFCGKNVRTRFGILLIAPIIALPVVIIISLLEASAIADGLEMREYFTLIGYGLLGSVFSVAAFMLLLPLFENVFRVLTVFRLHEMTGPGSKLLKRLKTEAPGTFNHSMVVAQLVESCAAALGENAELARAAAYYHDVGKLRQPDFFTENQGEHNLHDELTPELSADIIRSHTKDGYELLKAYRMPEFFADVALQHHGTLPITYFYTKALRMSDGEINVEDYSYTGPKPQSKIAAIVMIADACEAATRSLPDRKPEKVEQAVRSIIQQRMDLEQFSDCCITMSELQTIKNTLVGALTGIYHHRIKYPDVRFTRSGGVEDKGGSINDLRN